MFPEPPKDPTEIIRPMPPPPKTVDRLTVVLQAHHETHGEEPVSVGGAFETALQHEEQPYERRLKVGVEWMPLDIGFVKNPGYIHVENKTGLKRLVNPTEAEKKLEDSAVVEILLHPNDKNPLLVPPKQFTLIFPSDGSCLMIRCRTMTTHVNITVFPR